ncbi:hypothetical protein SDC9_212322 [bioreactor metagenome]|uniref:Uncharacterized protein n=1 Tax=bioreactor metagenome TaxID=1076179 RepID=A0A645JMI1_9ZZZZ
MNKIRFNLMECQRESNLFPQDIGGTFYLDNMKISCLLQTTILAGKYQNEVLIRIIYLLQGSYRFQRNKIHPMLLLSEDTLCFNGYFHSFLLRVSYE